MVGRSPGLIARRRLIQACALLPLAGIPAAAQAQTGGACVDAEALPRSQKNARRSANFQLQSEDPAKTCGGCAFYTAAAQGPGCGACAIFSGGPVAAASYCDRWVRKGS